MKLFWLLFISLVCSQIQAQLVDNYSHRIAIGYDVLKLPKHIRKSNGGFGPIYLKYDYKLSKDFSIGGSSWFYKQERYTEVRNVHFSDSLERFSISTNGFSLVPKFYYHLDLSHFKSDRLKGLDIYAGAGIGYAHEQTKTTYFPELPAFWLKNNTVKYNFPVADIGIGFNYNFYKNLGMYAEYGFSVAKVQFGLIYKL